ncbi:MAG: four helix bundle protein [Mailhella sp.]|nr:four helix bundle protein [Mailhella sp.]
MAEPVGGLILQQKWEDLTKYIFEAVLRNMPKADRFTLGEDIRKIIWEVEGILVQVSLRHGSRWQQLQAVDVRAKTLLAMVRIGMEIGSIPQKKYEQVSMKLVEIGKIIGGLQKSQAAGRGAVR